MGGDSQSCESNETNRIINNLHSAIIRKDQAGQIFNLYTEKKMRKEHDLFCWRTEP